MLGRKLQLNESLITEERQDMNSRKRDTKNMQYLFNDNTKDKMDDATDMLAKVTPANLKDTEVLTSTVKELKEGVNAFYSSRS